MLNADASTYYFIIFIYKIKDPVFIDLLPVFENQQQKDLFIKHHQICNTTNSHTCITYEIMGEELY